MGMRNIIELSEEKVLEEDWISKEDFYDSYIIGTAADYVDDTMNRCEDLHYFYERIERLGATVDRENETITFPEGFAKEYFKARIKTLKNLVKDLTLDQFAADGMEEYTIRKIIKNEFDDYIHFNYLMPLDSFVRKLDGTKTFHVGGVALYHC